jgi:hypothetical protein
MQVTNRNLRLAGHLKNVRPDLKPIKGTKVENIFYCSSAFGGARYTADSSTKAEALPRQPRRRKTICYNTS